MRKATIHRLVAPLALFLALAGCGGMPRNRGLESLHQPVVERRTYTLDLASGAGGLPFTEQQRLDGWFEALELGTGDRVAIDDPAGDPATREIVAALAARRGVLVGGLAPPTAGEVLPGTARVVISRTVAHVPGCPDWSAKSDVNLANATYPNFGCAVHANLAAMVADPEDLLRGAADRGTTVGMSASKAIESYRRAPPTGERGLSSTSSMSGGGSTGSAGSGQ